MGLIQLKKSRERQIEKQNEPLVIPPHTIDPVLYATIERDYSELLRIIIDDMSPLLAPQFIYLNGKSKSQGERDLKKMIELGLLGKKEWQGVDYIYPLRNARAWRNNTKTENIPGQRNYSDNFLFNRFMRNEMVIYRDKFNLIPQHLDIEKRVQKITSELPKEHIVKVGNRKEITKNKKIKDLSKDELIQFSKDALSELKYKNEITIISFTMNKDEIKINAQFSHNQELKPTHYYRYFKSILKFAERFGNHPINLSFEILVEKEESEPVAKNYAEKGLSILKRELNKSVAQDGKLIKDSNEFGGRDLKIKTEIYNIKLSRYFTQEMI